ncbi:cation diffusion facilitator family transporter, partial [Acidobacteriota bacterium]
EGFAFYRAFKKVNRERKGTKIVEYLRKTKKSELIVVFLEDLAAITGLSTAIILLYLQHTTGVLIFDGIASIIIGLILAVVAFFLGSETRSLLLGESASKALIKQIEIIFDEEDSINKVIYIKSLQLGPDNVLLAVKVEFNHRLSSVEISNLINGIEKEIRTKHPDVKSIFIEPDIAK